MNEEKLYIGDQVKDKEGNCYFVSGFSRPTTGKPKVEVQPVGVGFCIVTYVDLENLHKIN